MEKTSDLILFSNIKYLTSENSVFSLTEGGFLCLELDGETHQKVTLHRALPFTNADEYISVLSSESKELGIIKNVAEFDERQAEFLQNELSQRYYSPDILKILSVKEKMGYVYFKVDSSAGEKYFAVKDVSKNIRRIEGGKVMIFDVDGNRYFIQDLSSLDKKSKKRINTYFL